MHHDVHRHHAVDLKAHAFWATPALPVLFTISAISTGCAAIVLSIGGWPAQITLESLLAAALVLEILHIVDIVLSSPSSSCC